MAVAIILAVWGVIGWFIAFGACLVAAECLSGKGGNHGEHSSRVLTGAWAVNK